MIRVLIAEDSAVTREYITCLLEEDQALKVAGTARDGVEALEEAERLKPDIVLMDVHMPRLNGYEATRAIMERVPTPIVMISASFDPEGKVTNPEELMSFEALKAGALTIVEKPLGPGHPRHEGTVRKLVAAVKLMAEVKVVRRWPRRPRPAPASPPPLLRPGRPVRVVAIGASTGGPAAMAEVLGGLPADVEVPILAVQHIAAGFTAGLVEWLRQQTPLAVKLAVPEESARPGAVYVAPEGSQMGITSGGRIRVTDEALEEGFRPSASYLFQSVAQAYGPSALGILLTGMGRDGAQGLLRLREAGGITIAQNEETSVVFGMPGEAVRLGAAEHVLPPDGIAATLRSFLKPG